MRCGIPYNRLERTNMNPRKIKLHRHPTPHQQARANLLFVHGGYVDSSCWQHHFIPFFQRQGYDCFAVDLAGHGASEGRAHIDDFGIDDYAADVAHVMEQIDGPTIVIGHSMGTMVLERYLDGGDAVAAAFLSPVPPTGTLPSAISLTTRFPGFLQAIERVLNGQRSDDIEEVLTRAYFAKDMSVGEARRFMEFVVPESQKAIAEMATALMQRPKLRRKLPVVVMGGEEDAVFSSSMLYFSAVPWRGEVRRLPNLGHVLMLDTQWQSAANCLLEWMEKLEINSSCSV